MRFFPVVGLQNSCFILEVHYIVSFPHTYGKPESPTMAVASHSRRSTSLLSDQMAQEVISDSLETKFSLVAKLGSIWRRDQRDACIV